MKRRAHIWVLLGGVLSVLAFRYAHADGSINVTDARTRIVHVTSSLNRLPDGGVAWHCSGVCRFGGLLSSEISAGPATYAGCKAQLDTACTGQHLANVATDAGVEGGQAPAMAPALAPKATTAPKKATK